MFYLFIEPVESVDEPLGIDFAFQRFPCRAVCFRFIDTIVVAVIDVLDDGFAGVETVCVRHVMKEKQHIVGTRFDRFEYLSGLRMVMRAATTDTIGFEHNPGIYLLPVGGFGRL